MQMSPRVGKRTFKYSSINFREQSRRSWARRASRTCSRRRRCHFVACDTFSGTTDQVLGSFGSSTLLLVRNDASQFLPPRVMSQLFVFCCFTREFFGVRPKFYSLRSRSRGANGCAQHKTFRGFLIKSLDSDDNRKKIPHLR
jgi:hypothetical protein